VWSIFWQDRDHRSGRYAGMPPADGDPIANNKLVADPENNLKAVMKDGRIYKNTFSA
jgi:imidazolonepropionase-like amidohydrolase